jgi:hypothetical protein
MRHILSLTQLTYSEYLLRNEKPLNRTPVPHGNNYLVTPSCPIPYFKRFASLEVQVCNLEALKL